MFEDVTIKSGYDCKRCTFFKTIFILLFYLSTNNNAGAQEKTRYIFGLNTYIANVSWENLYFRDDKFDNLGTGLFYSPYLGFEKNRLYAHISMTKSFFDFNGPDGLTATGPDDDLDAGLDSEMQRDDIAASIGYQVFSCTNIFFTVKHFRMKINGDTYYSESMWSQMDYLEKGMLYGGGLIRRIYIGKSGLYSTFSVSYLTGTLVADYTFGTKNAPRKIYYNGEDISTKILSFKVGLGYKITSHFLIDVSYLYEYFSKDNEPYSSNLDSDIRYHGLNINMAYSFDI